MRLERHQDARLRHELHPLHLGVRFLGRDVDVEGQVADDAAAAAVLRLPAPGVELERDVDAERHLDADGVQVQVPVERRAGRQAHAERLGIVGGVLAHLVDDHEQVGRTPRAARPRLGLDFLRPLAGGDDGVVHDEEVEVARLALDRGLVEQHLAHLDRLDPAVLGQPGGRAVEQPVPVGRDRLERVLGRRDHQVRLAERPVLAAGPCDGGRQVRRVAAGRPAVRPGGDGLDFLRTQGDVFLEALDADVLLDEPRRHPVRVVVGPGGLVPDGPRPRPHLFVRDQRHRCDGARTMARLARALEDRRHVPRERRRRLRAGLCGRVGRPRRCARQQREPGEGEGRQREPAIRDGLHRFDLLRASAHSSSPAAGRLAGRSVAYLLRH